MRRYHFLRSSALQNRCVFDDQRKNRGERMASDRSPSRVSSQKQAEEIDSSSPTEGVAGVAGVGSKLRGKLVRFQRVWRGLRPLENRPIQKAWPVPRLFPTSWGALGAQSTPSPTLFSSRQASVEMGSSLRRCCLCTGGEELMPLRVAFEP